MLAAILAMIVGSLSGAMAAEPAADANATLIGRVVFEGEVPASALPDGQGRIDPLLEVDATTGGLRWAVVFLTRLEDSGAVADPRAGKLPTPDRAESRDPPKALSAAVVDQIDYRFIPRVLAVRAGEEVRFTNSDVANHNVRAAALAQRNQFNIYTGTGAEHVHRFESDAKQRPVQISCDIHPWMRAWVYVFDHPYFAVTDQRGRFKISAPPGTYRLTVRQPDAGLVQADTIEVGRPDVTQIHIKFNAADVKR